MPQPNYEALVKTVYPDARCIVAGIVNGYNILRININVYHDGGILEPEAWQSAYETLIKQNKIKPQ